MKIKKENIIVDQHQQGIEKNVWWGDYPCRNVETNRKLKKPLSYYFTSWRDYLENSAEAWEMIQ